MSDDWDEVADPNYPDGKPGKLARETIEELEREHCGADNANH